MRSKKSILALYQIILCAVLYNLLINQQILRYFYTKVDYFTIALIIDITEKPLRSCDAHWNIDQLSNAFC